jgi:uncharacterized Zn-finger protein
MSLGHMKVTWSYPFGKVGADAGFRFEKAHIKSPHRPQKAHILTKSPQSRTSSPQGQVTLSMPDCGSSKARAAKHQCNTCSKLFSSNSHLRRHEAGRKLSI